MVSAPEKSIGKESRLTFARTGKIAIPGHMRKTGCADYSGRIEAMVF